MTKGDLLSWAEIDLSALTHNIKNLRQHLRPGTQLMAVVKKNAYGHGAVQIVKAAVAAGAEWLGVHSLEEGLELRNAGITAPVLILGEVPLAQATAIVEKKLTPTITETKLPLALDKAARELDTTIAVHVKVDTGLNRSGASIEDVPRLLSNRGQVLIHGQRVPIRGRVCMDQCIVDVTTVPEVKVGDEVVLLGYQGNQEVSADEIANWADTINSEVFTRIGAGLRRIYITKQKLASAGSARGN